MKRFCLICNNELIKRRTEDKVSWNNRKFCSKKCGYKSPNMKKPPILKGEKNKNWKGGKPNCLVCNKKLSLRGLSYCVNHCIKKPFIRKILKGPDNPRWKGGKNLTEEQKERIERSKRTGRHPNYIEDRSTLAKQDKRNDSMYKDWRINIFKRDFFTCKIKNEDCRGRIEAHHILGWTKHKELRYNINNGITLCHYHHPRKKIDEENGVNLFKQLITLE